jgi:replicative DNA helicase
MMDQVIKAPQNVEAEQALIGAVLISPDVLRKIDIQPEDFYIVRNQWIWSAIQEIYRSGLELDFLVLGECLEKRGKLAELGGPAYLMGLINQTPTSLHAEVYAHLVKQAARRRTMIQIANGLAKAAYDGNSEMDKVIASTVTDLTRIGLAHEGSIHIADVLDQLYDDIETAAKHPKDIYGIQTGLTSFDRITGGMQRGEITILSGDPGLGKTMLAIQMACGMANPAKCNAPGVVYEMEMSRKAIARRQISAMSKIKTRAMKTGHVQADEWVQLNQAFEELEKYPVYISDRTDWTTTGLRADLARMVEMHGARWFCVDYFALLKDEPRGRGGSEDDRQKEMSGRLHDIAQDLNVSGGVIHSKTKAGINEINKGKGSIAGASKILYDAENIWILSRPDPEVNTYHLTSEKLREGDTDGNRIVFLTRVEGLPKFEESSNQKPPAQREGNNGNNGKWPVQ